MGNRLKGRVDWPYTKRCKGPAIIGVLRAHLKLGKGKRNLKKGYWVHRSKTGFGLKILPTDMIYNMLYDMTYDMTYDMIYDMTYDMTFYMAYLDDL